MANPVEAVQNAANKTKDFLKKLIKAIKFFVINPIGHVLAWFILIVFIVLLISYISRVIGRSVGELFGTSWNYVTFDEDVAVIEQLKVSGYPNLVDAENFQNFKAYEYGILMDVAGYLANNKQYYFDVYEREGEYQFERELMQQHLPKEYAEQKEKKSSGLLLNEWQGELENVEFVKVEHEYQQDKVLNDTLLSNLVEQGFDPSVRTVDYQDEMKKSSAGSALTTERWNQPCERSLLRVRNQ